MGARPARLPPGGACLPAGSVRQLLQTETSLTLHGWLGSEHVVGRPIWACLGGLVEHRPQAGGGDTQCLQRPYSEVASITSSHVPLANPEPVGSLHSLLREASQVRGHRPESSAQAGPETATQLLREKTTESVEIPDCRDTETGKQDPGLNLQSEGLDPRHHRQPGGRGAPDLFVLQQRTDRGPAPSPGPWRCSVNLTQGKGAECTHDRAPRGRGCANTPGVQLASSALLSGRLGSRGPRR